MGDSQAHAAAWAGAACVFDAIAAVVSLSDVTSGLGQNQVLGETAGARAKSSGWRAAGHQEGVPVPGLPQTRKSKLGGSDSGQPCSWLAHCSLPVPAAAHLVAHAGSGLADRSLFELPLQSDTLAFFPFLFWLSCAGANDNAGANDK